MPDSFDDMPEIELDDIVGKTAASDDDAIELDLDFDTGADVPAPATAPPAATVVPLHPTDDGAIDLGLDIDDGSADGSGMPLGDIDVDALASQVAQSQPEISESTNSIPVIPEDASEPAPVVEMPRVAKPEESSVDLDALLADIDTGLEKHATVEEIPSPTVSDVPRIQNASDALPDVGKDPMSALNVDLEAEPSVPEPRKAPLPPPPRATMELQTTDMVFEPEPQFSSAEVEEKGAPAELEAEVELDAIENDELPSLDDEFGDESPTVEVDRSAFDETEMIEALTPSPSELDELESEIELDAELEVEGTLDSGAPTQEEETVEAALEPLLDVLADEPTAASAPSVNEAALRLDDDSELSFKAEHEPIGEDGDAAEGPLTIAPIDDPEAP
ncbi:MAG: hypothetical protein AAF658_05810, partial [Myxococcota bacterium]